MLHKDCPDQEEKSDEAALQTEKDEETDITYVNVWSHGQMTPKQLSRCLRTIVAVKPEISQFWTVPFRLLTRLTGIQKNSVFQQRKILQIWRRRHFEDENESRNSVSYSWNNMYAVNSFPIAQSKFSRPEQTN